jgi:hypothetical protein
MSSATLLLTRGSHPESAMRNILGCTCTVENIRGAAKIAFNCMGGGARFPLRAGYHAGLTLDPFAGARSALIVDEAPALLERTQLRGAG